MQAYWYDERHQKTVYSAETILSLLLPCLPPVRSAVDLGCGVGTWLSVLQARGAQEVLGFDGDWVDRQLLVIPQDCFRKTDLSRLESSRSEEHTSELQSLMRISYAVFCLKKKKNRNTPL